MMRTARAFLAGVAMAGLAGCATMSAPPVAPSVPAAAPALDVSGEWTSNWGPVWLTQTGSNVTGQYYESRSGSLQGTIGGHTLGFTWQEGRLRGYGQYEFSPDNLSFAGSWNTSHAWNGTRVGPAPAAPARAGEPRPAVREEAPVPAPPPEKPKVYTPKSSWDDQL